MEAKDVFWRVGGWWDLQIFVVLPWASGQPQEISSVKCWESTLQKGLTVSHLYILGRADLECEVRAKNHRCLP